MKYNININQLALSKSGLDLKDCAIIEYIKGWFSVDDKKVKTLVISEDGYNYKYIWINFNTMIKDMPLLGIKQKASISERLAKIEKKGFIKRYLAPDGNLYVRILPKVKTTEFESVSLNERGVRDDEHNPLVKTNDNILLIKDNIINNSNGQAIAGIINCFKNISSTNYEKWFDNKTQRQSAKSLLKLYPYEKLENLIVNFLPKINVLPYVSKDCKAFSPYELEKNFDKIRAKAKELQIKRSELKSKIAIIK